MPQRIQTGKAQQEGRVELALEAYRAGQFRSLRRAAITFNVPQRSLNRRYKGTLARINTQPNCRKLTTTEEQTLIRYILDLDSRGFSPLLAEVADMADKLLAARGGEPVGKNWAKNFVARTPSLKMVFNRAKDRQRQKQEDPKVISEWFKLVEDTKVKYGVADEDVHNFDETGFQMGVIGSMKVVTGSERRSRPDLIQPGNREWVTNIQSICAAGYATPPFIIYKGQVHISAWYEEIAIPHNWKISVSRNGWTNNELGVVWLKHFDAYTRTRQVGEYRLLILDGHESHQSQDFKDYCLEHKILTLCMPPHSSHILQPLDVVCFSPLKRSYSQRVRALASRRVFHISKEGFLPAFRDAFFDVFTEDLCKKAFKATGLVPLDAQEVLERLDVQIHTPPGPPPPEMPWTSKTPSNTHEFGSQSKLIYDSYLRTSPLAHASFMQLVKGAELMLHQTVLDKDRITELEEQLEVVTKRKSRKRKRIQKGGTMEYGEAADQVAAEASTVPQGSKKARGAEASDEGQRGQRRCGKCRETGHNARTCQKTEEPSLESEASTQVIFSDSSDSDGGISE